MEIDLSKIKVLLVGDFMIDHYYFGSSNRLSPEAPIPVVLKEEEKYVAGGAGNVAVNLKSLGVDVTCMGFAGDDLFGKKLISILKKLKINTQYIELLQNHQTTVKQRIYCQDEQLSRLDIEAYQSEWTPKKEIDYSIFDIIVLSDYNKGTFHNDWFLSNDKDVILDPKVINEHLFSQSTIMTPNLKELSVLSCQEIKDNKSLMDASKRLIETFKLDYLLVTKGEKGMTLFSKEGLTEHINPHEILSPDVTGAGDTVIATFSVIYSKTRDAKLAANIANKAASIVVGKKGTVNINLSDIKF